ncbi:hypothetical protein [Haloarchaeobius sp. DYHT-AS-18]|uniref:hypothetical protein n=1 Tax=Haloarchaeobius sp. DYHT-AS-18 TaxID=3446117 RepID=UPI003EC0466E
MAPDYSWTVGPEDSRTVRLVSYLGAGVLGGMALFAGWILLVLVSDSLNSPLLLVGVLALLSLFVFRAVTLWPALRPIRDEWGFVDSKVLALASVVGLGIVLVSFRLGGVAGFLLVSGSIFVPVVTYNVLTAEGELNTDSLRLTYDEHHVDLATLAGVTTHQLGDLTLLRPSYAPGASDLDTPRLFVVPREQSGRLLASFETGIAADPGEYDLPDPAEGYALVGLGGLMLAVVAFLLVVGPDSADGAIVLTYVALSIGGLGALLVVWGLTRLPR